MTRARKTNTTAAISANPPASVQAECQVEAMRARKRAFLKLIL